MGGQVYAIAGADTVVREFVPPTNPRTNNQMVIRRYFTAVTETWSTLTDAQRASWGVYASGIKTKNPKRNRQRPISGFQAFVALSTKLLQLDAQIVNTAPAVRFKGDDVQITVTPGSGKVTLTANKANKTGVTTEILVQRLDASYLKPKDKGYRHQEFYQFTSGAGLTHEVTLPTGAWAVAYRFVKTSTGEATDINPLKVATVLLLEKGSSKKGSGSGDQAQAA